MQHGVDTEPAYFYRGYKRTDVFDALKARGRLKQHFIALIFKRMLNPAQLPDGVLEQDL